MSHQLPTITPNSHCHSKNHSSWLLAPTREESQRQVETVTLPFSALIGTVWTRIGSPGWVTVFQKDIIDQVMQFVEFSRQFVKESIRLVKRCTKPDRKEFHKIAMATAIGFSIMGLIGFFVKLIHIPTNNIIVGG
ncbi:protein transport protein Sec61 subunit gamma-like [Suncus etruscus]|uniref:protein transport protein Sec61 subunit gamma-like n=1 Tax=Suncus etruscus TaxID=109475 RepID=UPI00210F768E|nr:protein transport protein Sec61 subunit gamma-like [Suncus etruscus]